jgi:hypothetical protein
MTIEEIYEELWATEDEEQIERLREELEDALYDERTTLKS